MARLLDIGVFSVIDTDGSLGVGWKLNFYIEGSSTRKNTYPTEADADAATNANANPVVLGADARIPPIWLLEDTGYKLVLTDENDVVKKTINPVTQAVGTGATIATRTALAALTTSADKARAQYLTESGREGWFTWNSSNLSARVTLDTQQGVYVPPASAPTGASGAWVRQIPTPSIWHSDWFGVPADPAEGAGGGTQVTAHAEMGAMIDLGNVLKPDKIILGGKIITLGAAVPDIGWFVHIQGQGGSQGTIVCKRYVEADTYRGVFSFRATGGKLSDFSIQATSGSGGSGWSAILPGNAANLGHMHIENMRISGGDFFNYSRVVDGSANTSGSPSWRGVWETDCEYFGAALACIYNKSVQHWFGANLFAQYAGGTSTVVLDSAWAAGAINDDWKVDGALSGDTNLVGVGRSTFISTQNGVITVDADCTKSIWLGHRFAGGSVVNNAASGEFVFAYDGIVVASGGNSTTGWRKWGNGRLEQWGVGTTSSGEVASTWPVAFTSTAIKAEANAIDDVGATRIGVAQVIVTSVTAYTLVAAAADFTGAGTLSALNGTVTYRAIGS